MSFWGDLGKGALAAGTGGLSTLAPGVGFFNQGSGDLPAPGPMPAAPGYESTQNADGSLKSPYGVSGDQSGINFLNGQVNSTGASPWAQMALQQEGLQQTQAMDQAGASASANNAGTVGNLETHGGMTSGARETAAIQGARNVDAAQQGVQQTGLQQKTGIQLQDQSNKIGEASTLAGINNSNSQFNAGMAGSNVSNQNTYNQTNFTNQMKQWGAGVDANAIAHSGKK